MTDDVLEVMAQHENVCKYIHLPVQSGNSDVLKRMNRGYTREWYLERMESIHRIMPDCATSTDIISGFCGETEAEHQDTLSLMEMMRYDMAYMFSYSERPRTLAQRKYENDVPEEVKKRRLQEIMAVQKVHAANRTIRWSHLPRFGRRHLQEKRGSIFWSNHLQYGSRFSQRRCPARDLCQCPCA